MYSSTKRLRRRFEVGSSFTVYIFEISTHICYAEIPPEELASILAAPELFEFVDSTTKMFYRALNDYDYTRDYRVGAETGRYLVTKNRLLHF